MAEFNEQDVRATYRLYAHEKETEIRLCDPQKIKPPISLFPNDEGEFVYLCEKYNKKYNVYLGINERNPGGTSFKDVISVKTIVLDIDPKRETNTASTDSELKESELVADEIIKNTPEWMDKPIKAMSGNGYQLIYCMKKIEVNEENAKQIELKIKEFINKMAKRYSNDKVNIDQIGDLPRIIKVIGTVSIKGDNSKERPHRLSRFVSEPKRIESENMKELILTIPIEEKNIITKELAGIEDIELKEVLNDSAIKRLINKENLSEFKSRSEAEQSLVNRLVYFNLNKDQIYDVMQNYSKIGKWQEGNKSYQRYTLESAIKFMGEKRFKKEQELIINDPHVDFSELKAHFKDTHKKLQYFDMIEDTLGLDGQKYYAIKKMLCYFIEAYLNEPRRYQIGKNNFDNRPHLLIVTTAGKGKGVIKNMLRQALKTNEEDMMEISATVHPEQLIGKTIKIKKEEEPILVKGYFGAKMLVHDESNSVLNEKAQLADQCMRVKRLAMDCYGFNELNKKLVDESMGGSLKYNPETICIDFYHPENFASCFFDKGTYRRYFAFELDLNKEIQITDSTKSMLEKIIDYAALKEHFREIKENKKFNFEFIIDRPCIEEMILWINAWNSFCLNHPNSKVRRFGEMAFFAVKEYFGKLVYIAHLMQDQNKADKKITRRACFDTVHFLLETLETYCIYGQLNSTSDVWRGAKDMDIRALEYLYRCGAVSMESSDVEIHDYYRVLTDLFGVQDRQARGILARFKSNGWINTKHVGQYSTRIWLAFTPKITAVKGEAESLEKLIKETLIDVK